MKIIKIKKKAKARGPRYRLTVRCLETLLTTVSWYRDSGTQIRVANRIFLAGALPDLAGSAPIRLAWSKGKKTEPSLEFREALLAEALTDHLIHCRRLPFDVADKLVGLKQNSKLFQRWLIDRKDATPAALDSCARWRNVWVRRYIAAQPKTSVETLRRLVRSKDTGIVVDVLATGRLPDVLVDSFATSKFGDVRAGVARVSNNSAVLHQLAFDLEPYVSWAVVENPAMGQATANYLAAQPQISVDDCEMLVPRIQDPDLFRKMVRNCADMDLSCAELILNHPQCPDDLKVHFVLTQEKYRKQSVANLDHRWDPVVAAEDYP